MTCVITQSPDKNGRVVLHAALSPALKNKGGSFVSRGEMKMAHPQTYNVELQETAWALACKELQIKDCYNENSTQDCGHSSECRTNSITNTFSNSTLNNNYYSHSKNLNCDTQKSAILGFTKYLIQCSRVAIMLAQNFASYKLFSNLFNNLCMKRITSLAECYRSSIFYRLIKLN